MDFSQMLTSYGKEPNGCFHNGEEGSEKRELSRSFNDRMVDGQFRPQDQTMPDHVLFAIFWGANNAY